MQGAGAQPLSEAHFITLSLDNPSRTGAAQSGGLLSEQQALCFAWGWIAGRANNLRNLSCISHALGSPQHASLSIQLGGICTVCGICRTQAAGCSPAHPAALTAPPLSPERAGLQLQCPWSLLGAQLEKWLCAVVCAASPPGNGPKLGCKGAPQGDQH